MNWVGMPWQEWAIWVVVTIALFGVVNLLMWCMKQFIKEAVREVIDEEFEDADDCDRQEAGVITDLNEFRRLLRALLISSEYKLTEDQADRLLNEKPMIVVNGFMTGNLNATAVALMM